MTVAHHPIRRVVRARPRGEGEPSWLFLAAAYPVLFLFGAALGLLGVFLLPAGPHLGSLLLPIGLGIAIVGHPVAGITGLRLCGNRLAALMPMIGWVLVVLPLGSARKEGDVVLPGSTRSILYLLVGALAFLAVGAFTMRSADRGAPVN